MWNHGPIIYKDTKTSASLKKVDQKRYLAAGVYLSEAPDPPPPPVHTVCKHVPPLYLFTQGRGGGAGGGGRRTSEKVRGELVHKGGRKYHNWLTVSPVYNSIKHR